MTDLSPPPQNHGLRDGSRDGRFNYLASSVPPSLYRTGRLGLHRDLDGNDSDFHGIEIEKCTVPVQDARGDGADRPTLLRNGFELCARPLLRDDLDFMSHDDVVTGYYDDCARLVQQATGAAHVFAFDHNVRSASGKKSQRRVEGGQGVQPPAHIVHGDYTLTSGPQRLRDLARPPSINDTLRPYLAEGEALVPNPLVEQALGDDGRFALINVWRNIVAEPVVTHPLALCDAQTVAPEELVVFELHYADRVGENYWAKPSAEHRWYFYPGLTRDEALLIKQWDSAGPLARSEGARADASDADGPCTFSFHSAFQDPATPEDAPDRWSAEVRCVAIYD